MILNSLADTTLLKQLKTGFTDNNAIVAATLYENVIATCKEASDRMKKCIAQNTQYTLHDETHLLRVTEIIAKILGDSGLSSLNPLEIALLILSAYYHDIGMVMDDQAIQELEKNDEFKLFRENWIIEHPNYRELQTCIREKTLNQDALDKCVLAYSNLQSALLTDYIRLNHGDFSKQYIENNFCTNPLWKLNDVSFAGLVARICQSHDKDSSRINPQNGFRTDENVGTFRVNVQYLAILLRLGDILDFDKERTPDSLYKSIHFSSNISLNEWEKHRAVTGWEISEETIRFTAECTHPVYQRTILLFMNWIDEELNSAHAIVNAFPQQACEYKLCIPIKTDRSRIVPKENSYIYYDLEFTMSRDEIVKLLMMEELYNSPSLCVRELLQNSLDALRHRKNKFKSDLGIEWQDGKVIMKHYVDEYGREILLCQDNGMGMDENIVLKFLTKSGRSYYKSPEFEKEREDFKKRGIVFDPCSQFGIGFMSCFMIGDSITIKTRRDYGQGKPFGKPLIIDIHGVNGIIVIREGDEDQSVGTTVVIAGRKKPEYMDTWVDKVQLVDTLVGYALVCEFPIEATCQIPEIEERVVITTKIKEPKTFIEQFNENIGEYKTYKYALNNVNPDLSGLIKVSFLKDGQGKLTLDNGLLYWDYDNRDQCYKLKPKLNENNKNEHLSSETSACCDGILVCGDTGERRGRQWWANAIMLGKEAFVVDIRNSIKPKLSPSRIAKRENHNIHPSWYCIQELMENAQSKLWDQVIDDISSEEEFIIFAKLCSIYRFPISRLSAEKIWEKVYVPIVSSGNVTWTKISTINKVNIESYEDCVRLLLRKNPQIEVDEPFEEFSVNELAFCNALLRMSSLGIEDERDVFLHILNPQKLKTPLEIEYFISGSSRVRFVRYCDKDSTYLSICCHFRTLNIEHPIATYIIKNKYKRSNNALMDFAASLSFFASDERNVNNVIDKKVTRWMKQIGCRYKLVAWENYPIDYRPPYKIWSKEHGTTILTHECFANWAEAEFSNDDE